MNDDDSIEQQMQTHYQKFQREPGNPKHSLAIATLYEQRKEYANAIPWFQSAFEMGGCVDGTLEIRILDLRIYALEEELAGLQRELDSEDDSESRAKFQAAIDRLLEELHSLLVIRKERKHDPDQSN
jgi:hypothetical protein